MFSDRARRSPFSRLRRSFLALTFMVALPIAQADAQAAQSTLIRGAQVIDGTGSPAQEASVRIEAGTIVAIGKLTPRAGEDVIDAGGQILSPGFIDTHSHHDRRLFDMPDAQPITTQGITTIVVGQDGGSSLPLAPLFERIRTTPAAVNVASYVGHNSVRDAVMGDDFKRVATPAEIEAMRTLVRQAMADGALGLSSGLEYDPGIYSSKEEVLTLAKDVAGLGGRYISHIRSEDRFMWAALDEIVDIGRVTGMPVQVSHMKLAMVDWWGQADRFLGVMDRARAEGIKITGDVYPYEYWQSTLQVLFPKRDFTNRESAEFALEHVTPPDGLRLSAFSPDPSLVGKTVAEIAAQREVAPADALMQLIAETDAPGVDESVIGTSMRSEDIAKLVAWPHANISSDGTLAGRHPRGAGSFPRVLRLYVREQPLLTLPAAIHKMTQLAADHIGISDRGVIRPGARADIILFDPATIADKATIENPEAQSVGVSHVWVNGVLVLKNGKATGARPGQPVLRKTR